MSSRIMALKSTSTHSVRRFVTSITLAGVMVFGGASVGSSAAYADTATPAFLGSSISVDKFATGVSTPDTALTLRTTPVLKLTAPEASTRTMRKATRVVKVKKTRKAIRWSSARVSWYGPGFYGHTMAGGGQLRPTSMVVAHRSLKFGTKIQFSYKGRTVVAVVKDRGPYVSGRTFDLGPGTAKALKFGGVGTVKYRILKSGK